jgi:hypothetical protein
MKERLRQALSRGAAMGYLGIGHQPTQLGRRISVLGYALAVVLVVVVLGALVWQVR